MTASTCSIPDCRAPARSRGLCSKHYMRVRRHGDAETVQHPGRKPDMVYNAIARIYLPDRSPRTQARFARAMRLESFLQQLGQERYLDKAINAATGRRGSVDHAKVEGIMEYRVAVALEERERNSTMK